MFGSYYRNSFILRGPFQEKRCRNPVFFCRRLWLHKYGQYSSKTFSYSIKMVANSLEDHLFSICQNSGCLKTSIWSASYPWYETPLDTWHRRKAGTNYYLSSSQCWRLYTYHFDSYIYEVHVFKIKESSIVGNSVLNSWISLFCPNTF